MLRQLAAIALCLLAVPLLADDTSTHCDKRCVTGADNMTYCLNESSAQSQWPVMDGCEGGQMQCDTVAVQGGYETQCYPMCTGSYCYFV